MSHPYLSAWKWVEQASSSPQICRWYTGSEMWEGQDRADQESRYQKRENISCKSQWRSEGLTQRPTRDSNGTGMYPKNFRNPVLQGQAFITAGMDSDGFKNMIKKTNYIKLNDHWPSSPGCKQNLEVLIMFFQWITGRQSHFPFGDKTEVPCTMTLPVSTSWCHWNWTRGSKVV